MIEVIRESKIKGNAWLNEYYDWVASLNLLRRLGNETYLHRKECELQNQMNPGLSPGCPIYYPGYFQYCLEVWGFLYKEFGFHC